MGGVQTQSWEHVIFPSFLCQHPSDLLSASQLTGRRNKNGASLNYVWYGGFEAFDLLDTLAPVLKVPTISFQAFYCKTMLKFFFKPLLKV